MKKFFKNFYLLLIFLFLYAPIVVLMIFSFNDSKSRRLWNGFTTRWYVLSLIHISEPTRH